MMHRGRHRKPLNCWHFWRRGAWDPGTGGRCDFCYRKAMA